MKQILTTLTTIVLFTFVLPLYADYGVTDHGTWPIIDDRFKEPTSK